MQGEFAPAMKTFQGKLAKVRFPLEKISPSAKEKSTSLEIFSQFYFLKSPLARNLNQKLFGEGHSRKRIN